MSWEEGFFEVDLSQVKRPDLDTNWQQTQHGISRQEVNGWTRQLGELQRLSVERGYTYEDFKRMRNSNVPAERALGETHHKFYDYGHQASHHGFVSLAWNGKEYQVDDGNHRVYSAQERGLRRMPAKVSAPAEHMAQRKQEGYSSRLMHPDDCADFAREHGSSPKQTLARAPSTPSQIAPTRTDPGGAGGTPSARVSRQP